MIFRITYLLVWITLLALTVVIPNTAKELSVAALLLLALKYTMEYGFIIFREKFFLYLTLSVPITILYIGVGLANGAPFEATTQVLTVYILTPFLWGIVLIGALRKHGLSTITSTLMVCLFLAILTQAYYIFAFLNFGPEAVTFFVEAPNVNVQDGTVAAIMYVFGSMIFLTGGLMSSPKIVNSKFLGGILLSVAAISALSSGRSVLILSMIIGLIVNSFSGGHKQANKFIGILFVVILLSAVVYSFSNYLDLNLFINVEEMVDKLATRGGEGRNQQSYGLIDGIIGNFGLGSGHGLGVSYTVNSEYPWRYEMVWLATLYRVGIFGAMVYALPFIIVMFSAGRSLILGKLNSYETFIYGGFVCAFIASNTNPYIEAFVFQWMYILPIIYFTASHRIINSVRRW